MKNFLLLFLILTLSACTPQVTVTSQVTVTLPAPTETSIPTPTITFTPTPIVFTQDQLSQMDNEEKLDLAPETGPDGLVKGNVSEVKPNLVKYYDGENNLVQVYDLTEGKFKEYTEAGIIEIPLTTGEKWEMLAFYTNIPTGSDSETIESAQIETLEEIINFMVEDGVEWGNRGESSMSDVSQKDIDLFDKSWTIPNFKPKGYAMVPYGNNISIEDQFLVQYADFSFNGWSVSIITYISNIDGNRKIVFTNMPAIKIQDMFLYMKVNIPPKPQQ